jgi:hypothetical protein
MSGLFGKRDWSNPVAFQAFSWFYCRGDTLSSMTDFECFLLHKALSDHPTLITAPDRTLPDTPEKVAQVFADLEKRLAPWLPDPPPLVEKDHQSLIDAAELDALPDDYLHESGRWTVTPRSNLIWDRVKKRMLAEAEASGAISASDKRRTARREKRLELLREREERKREKGIGVA